MVTLLVAESPTPKPPYTNTELLAEESVHPEMVTLFSLAEPELL